MKVIQVILLSLQLIGGPFNIIQPIIKDGLGTAAHICQVSYDYYVGEPNTVASVFQGDDYFFYSEYYMDVILNFDNQYDTIITLLFTEPTNTTYKPKFLLVGGECTNSNHDYSRYTFHINPHGSRVVYLRFIFTWNELNENYGVPVTNLYVDGSGRWWSGQNGAQYFDLESWSVASNEYDVINEPLDYTTLLTQIKTTITSIKQFNTNINPILLKLDSLLNIDDVNFNLGDININIERVIDFAEHDSLFNELFSKVLVTDPYRNNNLEGFVIIDTADNTELDNVITMASVPKYITFDFNNDYSHGSYYTFPLNTNNDIDLTGYTEESPLTNSLVTYETNSNEFLEIFYKLWQVGSQYYMQILGNSYNMETLTINPLVVSEVIERVLFNNATNNTIDYQNNTYLRNISENFDRFMELMNQINVPYDLIQAEQLYDNTMETLFTRAFDTTSYQSGFIYYHYQLRPNDLIDSNSNVMNIYFQMLQEFHDEIDFNMSPIFSAILFYTALIFILR